MTAECAGAPASVRLMVYPATSSEPVREAVPGFGVARYVAVPLPVSEAPAVMLSHEASLAAVHRQPGDVATATVPTKP